MPVVKVSAPYQGPDLEGLGNLLYSFPEQSLGTRLSGYVLRASAQLYTPMLAADLLAK